jgi:hypothetical protein
MLGAKCPGGRALWQRALRGAEANVKKEDEIRDNALEKLLAKKLRAQMQPRAAGCPDAETLAAYVDGTLAARARAQWESHLAACSGCQEQVATLVRWSAEDAPPTRQAVAPARPRAFAVFRWVWAAPVLVAVLVAGLWYTGEFRSRLRQTEEARVEAPSPATAPAAPAAPPALNMPGAPPTQGEVAEARKSAAVLAKAHPQPRPTAPASAVDLLRAKGTRKDSGGEGAPVEAMAKLAAPAPPAMPEVAAKAEPTPLEQATGAKAAGMAKPSDRARMATAVLGATQMADVGTRTRESLEAGRGGGAAANLATSAVGKEREQAGATAPSALSAAGAMDESKGEKRQLTWASSSAQKAMQVPSAGGWRVGAHGLIQKRDARGNWLTVPSGVEADLIDVSFSSVATGWVVGQDGLILRTTDGGKTWKRIPSPTDEDLVKVVAQTDVAARIETRGHKVWETTDGGKSWTSSPPEQHLQPQ